MFIRKEEERKIWPSFIPIPRSISPLMYSFVKNVYPTFSPYWLFRYANHICLLVSTVSSNYGWSYQNRSPIKWERAWNFQHFTYCGHFIASETNSLTTRWRLSYVHMLTDVCLFEFKMPSTKMVNMKWIIDECFMEFL